MNGRGPREPRAAEPAIEVRGDATPDEVAAVLAALRRRRGGAETGYARWRRTRLTALDRYRR